MSGVASQLPRISLDIWESKYRLKRADGTPIDVDLADTIRRVAEGVAQAERPAERAKWAAAFEGIMSDFSFLPAGRILAGTGSGRRVTLFNCFVMGPIGDDMTSIFDNVKEAALTMQMGGGIGHDFSTLRPAGSSVEGVGADASGPVSFMNVWDAMCRTIMSAGARRGAMMATLRCDHPDIGAFIDAKRDSAALRNFNLSVLVSDAFLDAVRNDASWDLVFDGEVERTVEARALWQRIMRATYDYAEPGVIFIDRINAANNLAGIETIHATNPCGEQPLPAYGACLLGSVNLARLIRNPFGPDATLDEARLAEVVAVAIRFLDNVIDISDYPLAKQRTEAHAKRRLGLGVTGLADALIMCGVRYGSERAVALVDRWLSRIKRAAYLASARLAAEKGCFPLCDRAQLLAAPGLAALDSDTRRAVARHGLRNGLLTSIAPTGTISLLAGNVSSGIEPVFDLTFKRRVLQTSGEVREDVVEDAAHRLFRQSFGPDAPLTDAFVTVAELTPDDHIRMQAAAQPHIDSAISKTINCPADIDFETFENVYLAAFDAGLKGCTTFRPNPITGAVLKSGDRPLSSDGAEDRGAITAPLTQQQTPDADQEGDPDNGDDDNRSVVPLVEPTDRGPVLSGMTYRLIPEPGAEPIFVTINDTQLAGRRRPYEIFIHGASPRLGAWSDTVARMVSALLRRGGDMAFIFETLRSAEPEPSSPAEDHRPGPTRDASIIAAIGEILFDHLRAIEHGSPAADASGTTPHHTAPDNQSALEEDICPDCRVGTLARRERCEICTDCGYARCS